MYYFIVNPNSRSGNGYKIWCALRQRLDREKISYEVHLTEFKGHAAALAANISSAASFENPLTIVAMGGDGTIGEILTGLTNIEHLTLGFIPTGSGNDFCRGMGLPTDPMQALDSILKCGRIMNMDIPNAKSPKHAFRFGISTGIGFDAAVCHEVAVSKVKKAFNKIGLGKLIYILIALKQLLFCTPFALSVTLDNGKNYHYEKVYFAAIMNQKYEGGGFKFCPKALPDDHSLDLLVIEGMSRAKILVAFPTAYFGKHVLIKGVHTYQSKNIQLHSSIPAALHKDGESSGFVQEISVCMEKNTLKVIMPVL